MYKSEEHRRLTETFVKSMKDAKYAESTISRKILNLRGVNAGKMIYESLRGSSAAEKARILLRDISAVSTEPTPALEWDDRLLVPIGTVIDTQPNDTNGDKNYGKYKILKVLDNNNLEMVHLSGPYSPMRYGLSNMNSSLKSFQWEVVNATAESTKRIGKKPERRVTVVKNSNVGPAQHIRIGTANYGYIYQGPTSNCQLCLIGNAASFINQLKGDELKIGLKNAAQQVGKQLILLDIKTTYLRKLENNLPKDAFTLNQKYRSTNNSEMNIVLINVNKL